MEYVFNTVDTNALVVKYKAINSHGFDYIFNVLVPLYVKYCNYSGQHKIIKLHIEITYSGV